MKHMQIIQLSPSQLSLMTLSPASSAMDSSRKVKGQNIWQYVNNAATVNSSKHTDIHILIYKHTHLSRSINVSSSQYYISLTVHSQGEFHTCFLSVLDWLRSKEFGK